MRKYGIWTKIYTLDSKAHKSLPGFVDLNVKILSTFARAKCGWRP